MPSSQYSYSVVEPHPSVVASKSYIYSGRGGAGNAFKAPATVTQGASASGPASRASIISLSKPRLNSFSGRGGAGNIHEHGERAMFSFDEELERQMLQERNIAPVYYVGRGGAGNMARNTTATVIRRDSDANSAKSTTSTESGADIATRKLVSGFKKITKRA